MKLGLSLTAKVLLFICIPLVIHIGLLVALANLQNQAERALAATTRSQRIADEINEISADILEFAKRYQTRDDVQNTPFDDEIGRALFARMREHYSKLKVLSKDQPEVYSAVKMSERGVNASIAKFKELKEAFQHEQPGAVRRLGIQQHKKDNQEVLERLFQIGREQKRLSERAPEEQAAFRKRAQDIMIGIGVFDLLLGLAFALFLTKGITTRLKCVSDNTFRLASGLQLNPVMQGSDEIARLDQVFHEMAVALKESIRKERAAIENARDVICTIDTQGRFIATNPAAVTLLGYTPESLMGKHCVDLISSSDVGKSLSYFEALRSHNNAVPSCEIAMVTAAGVIVETVWSAYWSEAEQSFFCVIHDVTERRQAEKLKQEVMAMITHDLRSPLTTIYHVLDFLDEIIAGMSVAKGPRYIKMARHNADRMLNLINDLLDIEKIRSGSMTIKADALELSRCFSNCEATCAGFAEEKKVNLDFESTDLVVQADERYIDRVLSNLVGNALKFAPADSCVNVSARVEGGVVVTRVTDEGPGIPNDQLETIFERFRQVRGTHGAKGTGNGGSGLGLTICKVIVELHGGKIWAESGDGKGSAFIFTLPLGEERGAKNSA
jgi:PAS domain S-box-containing protein